MATASLRVTEYESAGLRLRLVRPPADLVPYLSAYYRTEVEPGVEVVDWLPPEEANLRTGKADIYEAVIGEGPLQAVPAAVLSGPTDRATRLRIAGGKFWGIGLTPAGWARFLRTPVCTMANRFCDIGQSDAVPVLETMLLRLCDIGDDIAASATLITDTFRTLLGEPPDADQTIQSVHLALLSEDVSSVGDLVALAGMTPRTFERFCTRHFGFTPRVLLRRQRFLRSLGKYMLDPSMKWIGSLDTHYWDQAHFIRDFRRTMNMTPSEFAALPHPISSAAVSVTSANAGVAMQALYHPQRSTDSELGL